MNVLGLITARGGSKGIPGKNLAPCGGKPLLQWTCDAALGATRLSRTVISTDARDIADAAMRAGIEAPFLRPAELAADTSKSIDAARHAIEWLAREEGWQTDLLVILQPTSPLRTAGHIDAAIALWTPACDSVVSVVAVPHRFAPWSVMEREGDHVREYMRGELPFDRFRRQGQPTLYARNGPVVLVSTRAAVDAGTFYGERTAPYVMSAIDSIDIDEPDDLVMADFLLRRREGTT